MTNDTPRHVSDTTTASYGKTRGSNSSSVVNRWKRWFRDTYVRPQAGWDRGFDKVSVEVGVGPVGDGYFQEIAEKTGQTLGNVRNHYYRGLERV